MIGNIAVPIVQGISSDSTAHVLEVFISLFFSTYALSNGLIKIYNNEYGRIACEKVVCSSDAQIAKSCCGTTSGRFFFILNLNHKFVSERAYINNVFSSFGQKGALYVVLFLAVEGVLYWIVTFALENNWISKLKGNKSDNSVCFRFCTLPPHTSLTREP